MRCITKRGFAGVTLFFSSACVVSAASGFSVKGCGKPCKKCERGDNLFGFGLVTAFHYDYIEFTVLGIDDVLG